MNDQKKSRFAVDLDEIERQVRLSEQTASFPSQVQPIEQDLYSFPAEPSFPEDRSGSSFEISNVDPEPEPEPVVSSPLPPLQGKFADPLSELARIVGQSDPFDTLLSGKKAAAQPARAPAPAVSERDYASQMQDFHQSTPPQRQMGDAQTFHSYGAARAAQQSQDTFSSSGYSYPETASDETAGHYQYESQDYQPESPSGNTPLAGENYPASHYYGSRNEPVPERDNRAPYDSQYAEIPEDMAVRTASYANRYEAQQPVSYPDAPFPDQPVPVQQAAFPQGQQVPDFLRSNNPPPQSSYQDEYDERAYPPQAKQGYPGTSYAYDQPEPEGQAFRDENYGYEDNQSSQYYEEDYEDEYGYEEKRSSRWPFYAGGIFSLLLVAAGGYFFMADERASSDPPLVSAQTEPYKIVPEIVPSSSDSAENHGIFGEGTDGNTNIVNREEQPVDVASQVRVISSSGGSRNNVVDIEQQLNERNQQFDLAGSSPNRVRSSALTVRADGTIILPEDNIVQNGNVDIASNVSGTDNRSANEQNMVDSRFGNGADNFVTETAQTSELTSSNNVSATTPLEAETDPTPAHISDATSGYPAQTPSSIEPQEDPEPRPRAPLQLQPDIPLQTRQPAQTNSGNSNYTVQLGIANSEQEARARFETLKRRFPGELDGMSPIIRQAEVNGNSIYRIRVPAGNRESARDFCARLSSAGGDCFVSRN